MPETRDDLPPLERAVSDTLDEWLVRLHGITSSHSHPREFLTWLREGGHEVVPADELERLRGEAESLRAATARVRRLCELTIDASCRAQAIDQAHDTLAALDGPDAQRALLNTMREQQAGGGNGDAESLRDRLEDALPKGMILWADDDELDAFPWDLAKWMDALGHKRTHTACCEACGCCITCMAGAFYDAVVSSVLRELDRMGALREPEQAGGGDG